MAGFQIMYVYMYIGAANILHCDMHGLKHWVSVIHVGKIKLKLSAALI